MKIAYEYHDYLIEEIAAIGDRAIAELDLTATTTHYYSGGACDPIESIGDGPRYRVETVNDPPEWLVSGLRVYYAGNQFTHEECVAVAVKVLLGHSQQPQASDLRQLHYKRGRFADSLREWFSTHGHLSPKQSAALYIDFRR